MKQSFAVLSDAQRVVPYSRMGKWETPSFAGDNDPSSTATVRAENQSG